MPIYRNVLSPFLLPYLKRYPKGFMGYLNPDDPGIKERIEAGMQEIPALSRMPPKPVLPPTVTFRTRKIKP